MAKLYIKNLKDYSLIAFSYNPSFNAINFKAFETKDCSGIDTVNNFSSFITTYVNTNILTMIHINDVTPSSITHTHNNYFENDYIDDNWVV